MLDGVAVSLQSKNQFGKQGERVVVGLQISDLAADMGVDAGDPDARQFGRSGVYGTRTVKGNAKLVLGHSGRDLLVRPGVDIRIDAERDVSSLSRSDCPL